jgi:ABC-type dipeptide/oligopeptide/nickel transport system permease subunit
MKRLTHDPRFWFFGVLLLCVLMVAVFAPAIAPHDYDTMNAACRLAGPSSEFPLGTDVFGRDVLSRLVFGARMTLRISLSAVVIGVTIGTALGLNAGYVGGLTELVIMRVVDFILAFPTILVAIVVVTYVGTSVDALIATIGILSVPRFTRVVHSATLAAKQNQYVEAARALGAPHWRILLRAILPNVMAPIMVQISLGLGDVMLVESTLSFLGLGPPPPTPSWGRSISEGTPYMHLNAYGVIWPSVILSLSVLAFNILGDSLRDALDPRLRT